MQVSSLDIPKRSSPIRTLEWDILDFYSLRRGRKSATHLYDGLQGNGGGVRRGFDDANQLQTSAILAAAATSHSLCGRVHNSI